MTPDERLLKIPRSFVGSSGLYSDKGITDAIRAAETEAEARGYARGLREAAKACRPAVAAYREALADALEKRADAHVHNTNVQDELRRAAAEIRKGELP